MATEHELAGLIDLAVRSDKFFKALFGSAKTKPVIEGVTLTDAQMKSLMAAKKDISRIRRKNLNPKDSHAWARGNVPRSDRSVVYGHPRSNASHISLVKK